MVEDRFDVIVVGAGMAGLCCAGELVLRGVRPLLISETKEVGAALRAQMVDGNRGLIQAPTWQAAWGGGWWPKLARELNLAVPVPQGFVPASYVPFIQGLGAIPDFPHCALSGATLTDTLARLLPPIVDMKDEFNRILHRALAIPYQDLVKMHDVRFTDWLEDQKADEFVTYVMVTLGSLAVATSAEFCREHVSVFGALSYTRSFFCNEAIFGFPYPDFREGFAIPLAREIERRGGTVWRGTRVAEVSVDAGRVGQVMMEDGREAGAPIVAMACGTSRFAQLLDPLPPELEDPVAYGREITHHDFNVFAVLDRPVVPDGAHYTGVLTTDGNMVQWMGALHNVAPWTTQPGKQFVVCGSVMRPDAVTARGGQDTILAGMLDVAEACYPGFSDATGAVGSFAHKPGHLWYGQTTVGPKVPLRCDSTEGLWFVSESSAPVGGIGIEHAASVGITGARQMAAAIRSGGA